MDPRQCYAGERVMREIKFVSMKAETNYLAGLFAKFIQKEREELLNNNNMLLVIRNQQVDND
jgi:hypothetical protein